LTLLKAWPAPRDAYFGLGGFIAFAFFLFPTEIHENYGYALLPLLAVAMAREPILVRLYVAISVTMTLNYALHDPPLYERLGLTDPHAQLAFARRLNSLANLVIFAVWALYLFVAPWVPRSRYVDTRSNRV
jgi:hypothetical protein